MAESETNLSASILGGSDIIFEFYCQPCDSENVHIEACGYCKQCQEFLCDNCTSNHRKYAALRSHKILDKANMPKIDIVPKVRDTLTEACPKHVDKVQEYFCNIHNELCCSVCINTKHKKCKDTSYVPDIADRADSTREFKELVTKLDRLIVMATDEQIKLGLISRNNDAYRSNATDNIETFRKEVLKEFDRAEKDTMDKIADSHQKNSDRVKTASQKCQSVMSDAKVILADLVEKSNAKKKNQLFVEMKLATDRLAAMENEMDDAANCRTLRYVFNKDEKVQEMVASLAAIWSLSMRQDSEDLEARYLGEVNVKTEEDTEDCRIQGITVLTGSRIVIADLDNNAVKLIYRKKVTSRLALSETPFDLTTVGSNQVAVSLSAVQKIAILTVTDTLSRNQTIDLHGDIFQGLSYDGEKFVLVYPYVRSVKTVDMSGRVLSEVYTDNDIDPLFKSPRYIALSKSKDVIYVSDYEANTVTSLTLKGQIISVYKHTQKECLYGVAVGRGGSVYVCSRSTHAVHQLSSTGQHMKVLVDEQQGMPVYPESIAYDEDSDRFYVGNGCTDSVSNSIRMFQVEVSRPLS